MSCGRGGGAGAAAGDELGLPPTTLRNSNEPLGDGEYWDPPPGEPLPGKPVGALAGGGNVGTNGGYSYSIPLWVPKGRVLQPELALSYGSGRGSGLPGLGWTLQTGAGSITRCAKTVARDGVRERVEFIDAPEEGADNFCLNGQKLVQEEELGLPDSEQYTPPAGLSVVREYRTEHDLHARVLAFGDGSGTVQAWDVLLPSGLVQRYGVPESSEDPDAATMSAPRFGSGNQPVTFGWLQTELLDRSGNGIRYKYWKPDDSATRLLTQIDYTTSDSLSHPLRSVTLNYDNERPDAHDSYSSGLKFSHRQRLTSIEMWVDGTGGTPVRRYELEQDTSSRSRKLRLTSVAECVPGDTCLPATTFEYGEPDGNDEVNIVASAQPLPTGLRVDAMRASLRSTGDYNGDGFGDLLLMDYRGEEVLPVYLDDPAALNDTTDDLEQLENLTFSSETPVVLFGRGGSSSDAVPVFERHELDYLFGPTGPNVLMTARSPLISMDADSDGTTEILAAGLWGPGYDRAFVRYNASTTQFEYGGSTETEETFPSSYSVSVPSDHPNGLPVNLPSDYVIDQALLPADVDGDGLLDLFVTHNHDSPNQVYHSEVCTPAQIPPAVPEPTPGDCYYASWYEWVVHKNRRSAPGFLERQGAQNDQNVRQAAFSGLALDLYGRGRAGVLAQSPTSGGLSGFLAYEEQSAVDFSENKLWLDHPPSLSEDNWLANAYPDVNGDGLPDHLRIVQSGSAVPSGAPTRIFLALNTGTGFLSEVELTGDLDYEWPAAPAVGFRPRVETRVADFNGDGRDDVLVLSAWVGVDNGLLADGQPFGSGSSMAELWLSDGESLYEVPAPALSELATTPYNKGYANLHLIDVDNDGLIDLVDLGTRGDVYSGSVLGALPPSDTAKGAIGPGGWPSCAPEYGNRCAPAEAFELRIYRDRSVGEGENSVKLDRLVAVENGIGTREEVHYGPRIQAHEDDAPGAPSPYEYGDSCQYPETCLRGGDAIVYAHEVVQPNGLAPRRFEYSYKDCRANVRGRGGLGCEEVEVRDIQGGTTTTTTYDQARIKFGEGEVYPEAGMPIRRVTRSWSEGSELVVEDEFYRELVWLNSSLTSEPNRYRVVSSGSEHTRTIYGPDSETVVALESTVVEEWDAYDFPIRVHTDVQWGANTTQVFEYEHRPNDWLLGLRTRSSTTVKPFSNPSLEETREVSSTYTPRGELETVVTGSEAGLPASSLEDTYLETTYSYTHGVVDFVETSNLNGTKVRPTDLEYDSGYYYVRSVANVLGHTTHFAYDTRHDQLSGIKDANQVITSFRHDGFGRLRETDFPDNTHTSTERFYVNPANQRDGWYLQQTDKRSEWSRVYFDRLGREYRSSWSGHDGSEVDQRIEFDARGRVDLQFPAAADPANAPFVDFEYDGWNRVRSVTAPSGSTTTSYPTPREVAVEDAEGRVVKHMYDHDGRLSTTSRYLPDGNEVTRFNYNAFGEVRSIRTPANWTTTYHRDRLGRVWQEDDPNTGTTEVEFNAFGDVERVDRPGLAPVHMNYDVLGRLEARVSSDGLDQYFYDGPNGLGNLAGSASADGVLTDLTYDAQGRVESSSMTYGPGTYETTYEYDPDFGHLARTLYPQLSDGYQLIVRHKYDLTGRLDAVMDDQQGDVLWQRGELDRLDRLVEHKVGDVDVSTVFDPRTAQVTDLTASTYGQAALASLHYRYYDDGLLRQRDSIFDGELAADTFAYDGLERLEQWTRSSPASGLRVVDYGYTPSGSLDVVSNDFKGGLSTDKYEYSATRPNIVERINGADLDFDDAGRETFSKWSNRDISYTSFDLPKSGVSNGEHFDFRYDAFGNRFLKIAGSESTLYAGLYERRGGASGISHVFKVQGPDGVVAQIEHVENGDTERVAVVNDPRLGSPLAVVRAQGGNLESVEYSEYAPFGGRIDRSGALLSPFAPGADSVTLGLTGHEYDDELGLVNMGGRMYDAHTRRMLTPDPVLGPVEQGRGFSPYAYVYQDPVNWTDPTGFAGDKKGESPPPPPSESFPPPGESVTTMWCGEVSCAPATPAPVELMDNEQYDPSAGHWNSCLSASGQCWYPNAEGTTAAGSSSGPAGGHGSNAADSRSSIASNLSPLQPMERPPLVTGVLPAPPIGPAFYFVAAFVYTALNLEGHTTEEDQEVIAGSVALVLGGLATRGAELARNGRVAAAGGGKPPNLFQVMGKERGTLAKQVLKGRKPLGSLTAAERETAAQWYRRVAQRTVGKNAEAAKLYNIARAEYLEGTRSTLEPTIIEFIKNSGL